MSVGGFTPYRQLGSEEPKEPEDPKKNTKNSPRKTRGTSKPNYKKTSTGKQPNQPTNQQLENSQPTNKQTQTIDFDFIWAQFQRKGVVTVGSLTNNYLESYHSQIKRFINMQTNCFIKVYINIAMKEDRSQEEMVK